MSFADRLKAFRIMKGLTQKELSEKVGITASGLRMWELGKREPSIEKIRELAVILEVSADDLLDTDTTYKDRDLESIRFRKSYDSLSPENQKDLLKFLEFLKIKEAQLQAEEAKQRKNS